jgi:hypothetical protein
MLFLAIFERIGDYGVTVNRYLVIAMAVGLSVVVIYFTLSRRKDIRLIPIVVFCLALFSAFGPFSAFSVSERNQMSRLDARLRANDIVIEGAAAEAVVAVAEEERRELSSMIDYLVQWHGASLFSRWFDEPTLAAIPDRDERPNDDLAKMFGFEYAGDFAGYWDSNWKSKWYNYSFATQQVVPIADYQYLVALRFEWGEEPVRSQSHLMGADSVRILLDRYLAEIAIEPISDTTTFGRLAFDLTDTLAARAEKDIPQPATSDSLKLFAENDQMRATLICQHVSGNAGGDSATINVFSGMLLIKRK